jgi:single-strand DNA-binding protein
MEGLNKVQLIGNVGTEPELKTSSSGTPYIKFRLGTHEKLFEGKEKKSKTEWHSVAVWGRRAGPLAKMLSKGDYVYVEGSLRSSKFESNGAMKYFTEIIADEVLFLQPKSRKGQGNEDYELPYDE